MFRELCEKRSEMLDKYLSENLGSVLKEYYYNELLMLESQIKAWIDNYYNEVTDEN